MAIKSYMIERIYPQAPDIDELPVSIWLGGRNLSLVTTDEVNVPLLCRRGFFVCEAFPGPVSCGKRMFLIPDFGELPIEIQKANGPVWCLDEPLPDI